MASIRVLVGVGALSLALFAGAHGKSVEAGGEVKAGAKQEKRQEKKAAPAKKDGKKEESKVRVSPKAEAVISDVVKGIAQRCETEPMGLDAMGVGGKEGVTKTCACASNKMGQKLRADKMFVAAVDAGDEKGMEEGVKKAGSNIGSEPLMLACAREVSVALGKPLGKPSEIKIDDLLQRTEARDERSGFVEASRRACRTDFEKRFAGQGITSEQIGKACSCISDELSKRLSDKDLVEIAQAGTMSQAHLATRKAAIAWCSEKVR